MFSIQSKLLRHAKKQKDILMTGGGNYSIETDPDLREMMKIAEKQIKRTITTMYKYLKEGIIIIGKEIQDIKNE